MYGDINILNIIRNSMFFSLSKDYINRLIRLNENKTFYIGCDNDRIVEINVKVKEVL